MEQQFRLKRGNGFTLQEQANMTAEDRAWMVKRIEREAKEQAEQERKSSVRMPRVPRIPRR